ncbi:MAG: type II toxin-antitoxin system VapC family toxin [Acidimicrobiales bacterium]
MTSVVIDASAGVELVADTTRGRALRGLLPASAVPWVPDLFFVECGAVLRRWDLHAILMPSEVARAVGDLLAWPLRVVQVRGLFADAWRQRANLTFSDAVYVSLAERLGAALLTDDHKLVATPNLAIRTLHLPTP